MAGPCRLSSSYDLESHTLAGDGDDPMKLADLSSALNQDTSSASSYGANSGPTRRYRWFWRRPELPFAAPVCCGKKCRRIGMDSWRCRVCAARIHPERLHHRLTAALGFTPFGQTYRPWKRIFKVETYRSPWRRGG